MKARGHGAILNIASTAGLSPRPAPLLVQRLQGLDDHRDQGDGRRARAPGVRVNALCPVAGETPLLKSFLGEDTPEMRGEVPRHHPARPLLDAAGPRQRRRLPLLDEAAMLTGVALEVDGGRCI